MEATPPVTRLVSVAKGVADAVQQRPGGEATLEDTRPIEQTMATLTPEAIGIIPYAHDRITPAATLPGEIRYLHLAQEATFSVGVFVLPPGACIPLHDHPNMCVVSHVLYGSVKITAYDRVPESTSAMAGGGGGYGGDIGGDVRSSIRAPGSAWFGGGFGGGFRAPAAEAAAPAQLQHQHQLASLRASAWHHAPHTSRLTPIMANIHELEAGSHGTAILDVLIPPYDESSGRDCTYYRAEPSNTTAAAGGGRVRLVPCSPADEFRVVRGEFVLPLLS